MGKQRADHTRRRKNRIMQLPDDIKANLDQMLREDRLTQLDILDRVNQQLETIDEKPISQTSLSRYCKKMAEAGQRIAELRSVSEVWVEKLGDVPSGDVSKLLIELIRTLSVEVSVGLAGKDEVSPETLNEMALMVLRLEQAASANLQREKEIRMAFAEEAAKEMQKRRKNEGMSEETIIRIKRMLLGIA